jgi:hypothetical protein
MKTSVWFVLFVIFFVAGNILPINIFSSVETGYIFCAILFAVAQIFYLLASKSYRKDNDSIAILAILSMVAIIMMFILFLCFVGMNGLTSRLSVDHLYLGCQWVNIILVIISLGIVLNHNARFWEKSEVKS